MITVQPRSAAVTTGQAATFTVEATSSCGPTRSQWQFNGTNIFDGSTYVGTATRVLTVHATAAQAGSYRAVVTCINSGKAAVSDAANLIVNPMATVGTLPPIIQEFGWSGCSGGTCRLWWIVDNAARLTLTPMGGSPVTVTGLKETTVSPLSSTIYTLTASNSAGTYAQNVFVPVGGYTRMISTCGTISNPGRYLVTTNLTAACSSCPCLDVRNTNNVFIDFADGVTVTGAGSLTDDMQGGAISFTNVRGFALRNSTALMSPGIGYYFMKFENSSLGYVFNGVCGDARLINQRQVVRIANSDYITFCHDKIYSEVDIDDRSMGNAFRLTTIRNANTTDPLQYTPGSFFGFGFGTQLIGCTLDGAASAPKVGADDGIQGNSLANEVCAYNTFENYWDSAIEMMGQSSNVTIFENAFHNCGIRGLYWNGQGALAGSIVSWNYIDMATPTFAPAVGISYGIDYDSYAPIGVTLQFTNNNFNNNLILNGAYSTGSKFITYATEGGGYVVGGNVFASNNFNYNRYPGIPAPMFSELPNIASDGGGNICAHPNPQGYPLDCH